MDDSAPTFTLARYDAACRAIAEAKAVDEVKEIRDRAVAMKAYAKVAKNKKLEADAIEIRMLAEERIGDLMEEQRESVGLNQGAKGSEVTGLIKNPVKDDRPTLAEAGIDKNLANRARVFHKLKEEGKFDEAVKHAREAVEKSNKTVVRTVNIEEKREPYQNDVEEGCGVDDLVKLAATGYRAKVIYADPPWSFEVYSGKGKERSAERHYDTMSLDDIKAMGEQVRAIADRDCALFLWGVWPELPGALDVISSWGFAYKTAAFVWVKTTGVDNDKPFTGMGYWSRANSEPCFLATRGSPERLAKDVHQVIMSPRGDHSVKPDETRRRIERLIGGPYLELFARQQVPGWRTWGNQIPADEFGRAAE